jgi:hypothetical protein
VVRQGWTDGRMDRWIDGTMGEELGPRLAATPLTNGEGSRGRSRAKAQIDRVRYS